VQRERLVAQLNAAVDGVGASRVRLAVDRRGRIKVSVDPYVEDDRRLLALAVDPEPVDTSSPFLYHKTSRREVYEIRLRRHPTADDVLMVNERGEVTESTIANVAVKLAGQWCTPPMDAGCLPGIYRQVLLEQGSLTERAIRLDELADVDGIALLNSVRLWRDAFVVADG
jgi:para-aminobenzoate synthetase/4-amino-4-deoxychorismate lyase